MVHELKTWPEHLNDVISGAKKVEIRKNDRDFQVDDILWLIEFDPETENYGESEYTVKVTHILSGDPWLPEGYVALSISPVFLVLNESQAYGNDCPNGACES